MVSLTVLVTFAVIVTIPCVSRCCISARVMPGGGGGLPLPPLGMSTRSSFIPSSPPSSCTSTAIGTFFTSSCMNSAAWTVAFVLACTFTATGNVPPFPPSRVAIESIGDVGTAFATSSSPPRSRSRGSPLATPPAATR